MTTDQNLEIQEFVDFLNDGGTPDEYTPETPASEVQSEQPKNGDTFLVVNWWVPVMFAGITLTIFLLTRKK